MRHLDTSSVIYAWDNYPPDQFPGLWKWVENQVAQGKLGMASTAIDELSKSPDCKTWFKNRLVAKAEVSEEILVEAVRISHLLGITNDEYGDGVGENDILIIATAKVLGCCLVSEEKRQLNLPQKLPKYKIPAVCSLSGVNVQCLNFIELIKQSGEVF